MTTTEKRKFNWALFIITLIFCFPVAIIYALWYWLSGTRLAKIGGNGLLMIFAVVATINTAALVTIYYFLPALLLSIAMIVFTVLAMKGIKPKLFTILNAVSILLIFVNIAFFGGWLYNIGVMFALPIGVIGLFLCFAGLRKGESKTAEEAVEEPAEETQGDSSEDELDSLIDSYLDELPEEEGEEEAEEEDSEDELDALIDSYLDELPENQE
ncbi:MAG: hypothetical protein IJW61_04700 [Clostridia bacterium]|nr:hypothetical protein [Clostridia bacterium]